jgi:GH35 family endo-1,4-beta-xylanase
MSGNQQPSFVNTLISSAAGGNATSKTNLRNAISSRINYYVGTNGNRGAKYVEIDVHNEALWNPSYWNIFNPTTAGASSLSIASIFNDVHSAAVAAGNPNLRLYTNEFNVLQFSPNSISSAGVSSGSDQYANWYRDEVEAIKNAGGAVSGIGMQEYANLTQTGTNAHSAATIQKALQNLSVEGLPLTMAEYGHAGGTTSATSASLGPAAMDMAVRMFYGNPLATSFMMWGWWDTSGNTPPAQMIITTPGNSTYTLTALGQKWAALMNEFSTHTSATVDANGAISFNGFYGDYNIGSQSLFSNLALAKGTTSYSLNLTAPPQWSMWNVNNSGTWGSASNWIGGGIANSIGQTAYFGNTGAARSITVDAARTVGMLAINSTGGYTIGGAMITLDGSAGQAAIYVANGSHQIDAPLMPADDTTITVAPAGSMLTLTNLQASNVTLTKAGAGTVVVNNLHAAGLNVGGGTMRVAPNGTSSGASNVSSLVISGATDAWTSKLDLTNNSMIIGYTDASPLATIQNQIQSGADDGNWTGMGISSSAAASVATDGSNPHKTGRGFGDASALGLSSFAGQSITGPAIVIRYTLLGDGNLDGAVNALDFNALASNFGASNSTWILGDFDLDGEVDSSDFAAMATNFNSVLSPGVSLGSVVPEPASLAAIAMLAALAQRRRNPRRLRLSGSSKPSQPIRDAATRLSSSKSSGRTRPNTPSRALAAACFLATTIAGVAQAQTTLTGSSLAMKSRASATLGTTSFVGTYLVVPSGGATVNFTVNANAGASGSGNPHMQLVIADTTASFSINSTSATNYATSNITLPAGTYMVRNERDYSSNVGVSRSFTVNNLSVNTVGGSTATFSNINDGTTALAAADTYITNFRQGPASVALGGPGDVPLLPGTSVNTNLARIGFNFGTAVPGSSPTGVNNYLGSNNTTQQTQYQAHLLQNFNAIVPENMGKWSSDEPTQGNTSNMSGVDTMLNYAQAHHMNVRMHNLIWGSQQPSFATTLLSQAAAGSMTSQTNLRNAITSRINYYVGTGTASDRANKYQQLDVYNESYHTGSTVAGSYWNVYTPTGIADMYRQAHAAAPNVPLFVNDYNIFEDGGDRFANYYAQHIEQLRSAGIAAGFGDVVGGIGTQYYPNNIASVYGDPNAGTVSGSAHNPARVMQTLQNLSTGGLPIVLTEFGVKPPGATGAGGASISLNASTQQAAASILSDSMRLVFGNPNGNGFMMWGFQAEGSGSTFGTNLFQGESALYTVVSSGAGAWSAANWTLTPSGQVWQTLLGIQNWGVSGSDGKALAGWTTQLTGASAPIVGPDGKIAFTGFYGDYNIGNQSGFSNLSLIKGATDYFLALAAPPNWSLWNAANSGSLSAASNWTTGGVPNVAGQTAYFGPAASARTVTSDAPRTLGMLALDSAGAYTIGGTGTISLQGFNNTSGHVAAIYVASGSHQIDAAIVPLDNTTITVAPAVSTLTLMNLQPSTVGLTKAGAGKAIVNNVRAAALNIAGGTFAIAPNGTSSGASFIDSLTIAGAPDAWLGTLDLTNNDLAVANGSIATIQNQIRTAYSNGTWLGPGITSSHAAAIAADSSNPHKTGLGFATASSLGVSMFDGQPVSDSTVLIRYTLLGDSNLDHVVNALDFNALASNFAASNSSWVFGDFNLDGNVDSTDFAALATNFNSALSPTTALGSLVPEPAALGAIAMIAATQKRRRRKRH